MAQREPHMGFIERIMDRQRRMLALQFDQLPLAGGEIVFLGDSITEAGRWHEWFPDLPVVNRGIGGDTTDGVLRRMDSAINAPSKVFLLIGTNDISFRRPRDLVHANQRAIIEQIRARAPHADLYVQSVMPRTRKYRQRIDELNSRFRELAAEFGGTYLDLWPALSDAKGELNADFSLDRLHLNGAGYRAWTAVLRPLVYTTSSAHREA